MYQSDKNWFKKIIAHVLALFITASNIPGGEGSTSTNVDVAIRAVKVALIAVVVVVIIVVLYFIIYP